MLSNAGVVLDHQHRAALGGGELTDRPAAARRGAAEAAGRTTVKVLPSPRVLSTDDAVVQLDQALDQGQAETGAAVRCARRLSTCRNSSKINSGRPERCRCRGRRPPAGRVERQRRGASGEIGGHDGAPPRRRELHGVGEQVEEDLLEPHRIGLERRQVASALHRGSGSGAPRPALDDVADPVDDGRHVDRLGVRARAARPRPWTGRGCRRSSPAGARPRSGCCPGTCR